jgi:hypothetical protein
MQDPDLIAMVSDSLDTLCIMLAMQMRPDSSWSATCRQETHQTRHTGEWSEQQMQQVGTNNMGQGAAGSGPLGCVCCAV